MNPMNNPAIPNASALTAELRARAEANRHALARRQADRRAYEAAQATLKAKNS